MNPTVSFVVPCYKLSHLLAECIQSILAQTYEDFEVLIMDDCSPDDTPQVAQSFADPRVKHIRNEVNLGHLRNYNKGIQLAKGKYIWLISADDKLRSPHALAIYVSKLESQPKIGYVFCPAIGLNSHGETRIIHSHGSRDKTFSGHEFVKQLLNSNSVVAASGIARKECYEKVSYFPLDMPWGGDWYLWCVFALHYDVAYVATPLVNYRTHELSMTNILTQNDPDTCAKDDAILPERVKLKAQEAGFHAIAKQCMHMIAYRLAKGIALQDRLTPELVVKKCEEQIRKAARNAPEALILKHYLYRCLGDIYFWKHETSVSFRFYANALRMHMWAPSIYLKVLLLCSGRTGTRLRERVNRRKLGPSTKELLRVANQDV